MEKVLVSRQPIFNADLREYGYELLYRSNHEDHAVFSDGDQATAEVILNTFEIGLEELVGERVETREQFERCKELGFEYFQGYFFCKPQIMSARRISVNRLSALRMIAALNDPQIKIRDVEKAISQDARLTYKLLRYANS